MIERETYLSKIRPFIDKNIIKVLTGIRRSGKSVMLSLIIEELKKNNIKDENIILINFDSEKYQNIENHDQLNKIIAKLTKNKTDKLYLFFDEIQKVKGWEKSIIGYYVDLDVDIYITGSNSKLLSGELATLIAGRYVQFKIYPFSFRELIQIQDSKKEDEIFNDYINKGGMPPLFQITQNYQLEYLRDIYSSIILKDILQRHNLRDVDLLNRIIKFVMANIGQTFSANSISKYLKNEKRNIRPETIYNYLSYCEDACLIEKVFREDLIGKKILKTNEKFYLTDHGFRQAICGGNKRDIHQILENIVYLELLRQGFEITIGKINGYEIDFICRKQEQKIYIQVTYILTDETTIERELRPLLKLKDNYPKYIVSMDSTDFSQDGIIHMNIKDFLKIDF